jgi:hypothetical protein
MNGLTAKSLQGFENRAVIPPKQPVRGMQPLVRVESNQMGVKRCMMDF